MYIHCIRTYVRGEINKSKQETLRVSRDFNNAVWVCT